MSVHFKKEQQSLVCQSKKGRSKRKYWIIRSKQQQSVLGYSKQLQIQQKRKMSFSNWLQSAVIKLSLNQDEKLKVEAKLKLPRLTKLKKVTLIRQVSIKESEHKFTQESIQRYDRGVQKLHQRYQRGWEQVSARKSRAKLKRTKTNPNQIRQLNGNFSFENNLRKVQIPSLVIRNLKNDE